MKRKYRNDRSDNQGSRIPGESDELFPAVFQLYGYHMVVLDNDNRGAIDTGLKYVNNDACFPSITVVGQLMQAVLSGKYDTNKLAVIMTQTGGCCRASNYVAFIRRALEKAGLSHIPVISLNANGMEKHSGMKITPGLLVDAIQGGAGTSANMNMNEVIANRANELLGGRKGGYTRVHPNDHVNCGQSTNDIVPTAGKLTTLMLLSSLIESLERLQEAFSVKAKEFDHIIKMGRTQLEDAVPMTLGQTFGAFAQILKEERKNLEFAAEEFLTVNMGATAIGTGICSEPEYSEKCIAALRQITGWDIKLAEDLVAATSDTTCMVGYSSALRRVAVKLNKICNDLRLLGSGPRCGLHEFDLPARQPGSSIMPGKVNPVIPEVMNQICYKVIGNDACVAMCAQEAQMELNAMEPTMAQCCFESAEIMMNGFDTLRINCVDGIKANEEQCLKYVQDSFGVVTALNPVIGYKNSTKIAKEAMATGRRVYDLVLEHGILTKEELDIILSPENLIKPVKLDIKPRR